MDILDYIEAKFSKNMLKKNKGIDIPINTNVKSKASIIGDFFRTKKSYRKELERNFSAFKTNTIDRDEFLSLQREAISNNFKQAFLLGKQFSDEDATKLSEDENRSIGYQIGKEMQFMNTFSKDIMNGTGKMDYSRRLKMYSDSLKPMFIFGKIVYLPEDVQIYWKLGITDKHCIDCLTFAMNSPYGKKDLPTVPQAGNTACLSNCLCQLEFKIEDYDNKYENFLLDKYMPSRKEIPDEMEIDRLIEVSSLFYRYRGLYAITNNATYLVYAKKFKLEYSDTIHTNNYAVSSRLPIAKYVAEIKLFASNEHFEVAVDGFTPKDFLSVFDNGRQFYGEVISSNGMYVKVKDISGKVVDIDIMSAILFKLKDNK